MDIRSIIRTVPYGVSRVSIEVSGYDKELKKEIKDLIKSGYVTELYLSNEKAQLVRKDIIIEMGLLDVLGIYDSIQSTSSVKYIPHFFRMDEEEPSGYNTMMLDVPGGIQGRKSNKNKDKNKDKNKGNNKEDTLYLSMFLNNVSSLKQLLDKEYKTLESNRNILIDRRNRELSIRIRNVLKTYELLSKIEQKGIRAIWLGLDAVNMNEFDLETSLDVLYGSIWGIYVAINMGGESYEV